MDEKPISRRRLGDAFDEFAESLKAGRAEQPPTVDLPESLEDDLRGIVVAAVDLSYYRSLDRTVAGDLAAAVASELEHRASHLPEREQERAMLAVEHALANKRRGRRESDPPR